MLSSKIHAFQKALLAWYQKNARDLPWRHTKDPYAIWVSEIMLQQTQVKTVIPYYDKWMKRFPSVKALAESPLNDILKYWAGLGYYRRARMLHQAARTIVKNFAGRIPKTAQDLQKIPGIGRYTSGAIASIAYEEKVPVLDGNVIRILTRIDAVKEDIASPKTIEKLWILAEKILPDKRIGDFNQALMELGATLCFPQNPSCLVCPVAGFCKGFQANPERFPVKKKKESLESLETAALILRNKDKFFVQKQPEEERWGGLWMFPYWKNKKNMFKETGLKRKDFLNKMTVKHGFTKYKITLRVYECPKIKNYTPKNPRDSKWVNVSELKSLPFPSPHQKIVQELLKDDS